MMVHIHAAHCQVAHRQIVIRRLVFRVERYGVLKKIQCAAHLFFLDQARQCAAVSRDEKPSVFFQNAHKNAFCFHAFVLF